MVENEVYFVEWMEEFVSQERGRRIVHYILKDSEAKSVLAVVGTERSLRHMVYVVADEFLSYAGPDNPIQAGFKWRSRREVVDWLTSMLAKHQTDSPRDSTNCIGSGAQRFCIANKVDHRVRHLKQSYSDIVWLGASWICGKQLKHFPAFCRNGTTIAAQSFVFVMAKEESLYVAYLEDMYEDKKGQKKVKVRWFHHSQEVKGVVRLRNAHPKEVYITPYTQVISVECVDGPAIVLTRDHFEKCIGNFPDDLLGKVHLCFRQFRSNKIKPFDLSKLRGYFDQPLISCLQSNTFPNFDSGVKVPGKGEYIGKGTKRVRNSMDQESFLASYDADEGRWKKIIRAPFSRGCYSAPFDKKHRFSRNVEIRKCHTQLFKVDDKVELLCQDSGIRGCWFRCTVLEISRKQLKLQYNDLEDQDGCGNLQEWVPAFRLAAPDKLGMRFLRRPTIRPCPPYSSSLETEFEVGDSVDAWWSDGWWEGVVTAAINGRDGNLQIYVPGENLYLDVPRKDLRISKDWVGEKWVDVKANYDVLSAIDPATKVPIGSLVKDDEADHLVLDSQDARTEDKEAVIVAPTSSAGHPEQVSSSDKGDQDDDHHDNEKSDHLSLPNLCFDGDTGGNGEDHNVGVDADYVERGDISATEVARTLAVSEIATVGEIGAKPVDSFPKDFETAALSEGQCGDGDLEAAIPSKEALQLTDVAAVAQVDQEKSQDHAS